MYVVDDKKRLGKAGRFCVSVYTACKSKSGRTRHPKPFDVPSNLQYKSEPDPVLETQEGSNFLYHYCCREKRCEGVQKKKFKKKKNIPVRVVLKLKKKVCKLVQSDMHSFCEKRCGEGFQCCYQQAGDGL